MRRIGRRLWQALFWVNVGIILWYWWQGSGDLMLSGGANVLIALGRLSGLALTFTVLLQFVFMGRAPWLERVFGLDTLARVHRTSGKWSIVTLLLHPLLLVIGYSQLTGLGWLGQLSSFIFDYEHVQLAFIAAILLLMVVVTSLAIVRSRWRYESWYFVHLLVYAAVGLALWHQFSVGTDLLVSQMFYSYWVALYVIVLGNHLIWRVSRPLWLLWRHRFVVDRVVSENHNTISIYIRGRALDAFVIYPGQFMIVRFLTKGLWWQAHPFSLSWLPKQDQLRITVKAVGDFTQRLPHALQPGTSVLIDGPYGVFTEWASSASRVLFIAGGIGITPIRALMERMVQQGKDVVLLYGNRTAQDVVFADELTALAKKSSVTLVNIFSDAAPVGAEQGMIDAVRIKRLVPDVHDRDVFLCGPAPMIDAVREWLQSLGVPPQRIHFEKFVL